MHNLKSNAISGHHRSYGYHAHDHAHCASSQASERLKAQRNNSANWYWPGQEQKQDRCFGPPEHPNPKGEGHNTRNKQRHREQINPVQPVHR